jgi:glycosyltransferase involved in cell wall biosynthesis
MELIDLTLSLINKQEDISGTRVIIADSSDDSTRDIILSGGHDNLNITIIDGGYPSVARNKGAMLSTTPYILFLDADMFILDPDLLTDAIKLMRRNDYDLLTTKVRTTNGKYNYVFRFFDVVQKSIKVFTPFCLGGFMLFKTETFNRLGGFDEEAKVAEDYLLSKQVFSDKFKIMNTTVFTPPRRFENKGLWYMTKLMVKSFFNRNNKKFFSNHNTYWK